MTPVYSSNAIVAVPALDTARRITRLIGVFPHRFGCSCLFVHLVILLGLCTGLGTDAEARPEGRLPLTQAVARGEPTDDRSPFLSPLRSAAGADTFSFGYVDSEGFAILGEIWNFDHGGADPLEGWTSRDLTQNEVTYFRPISDDIWSGTGGSVEAPVLSGLGSVWCGAFESEADDLCWVSGLGYGNDWRQNLSSPILVRALSSDVSLDFSYFNDLEEDYDFMTVVLRTLPSEQETEIVQFTDRAGLSPTHPTDPPIGALFSTKILDAAFAGETDFQVVFRMTSDASWSDEDGLYPTEYGSFSLDDVIFSDGSALDVTYGFETGLEGWVPGIDTGFGSHLGVANRGNYVLEEAECNAPTLVGNALELHDDNLEHPSGQHEYAITPPVDVLNDVPTSPLGQLSIFADWEQYSDMPGANGVFYRPGWDYYPSICPATGKTQWSDRAGQFLYLLTGDDPVAFSARNVATDHGIPSDVEQIRFIYELYSSCDAFAIPPGECSGTTNFSPLIDNVQIRFTYAPSAPVVDYDVGSPYQDGFGQFYTVNLNSPGDANTALNTDWGNNITVILGDSLTVSGPVPSPGFEYDTRLWFRVARKGPGNNTSGYDAWRTRVQQSGGIDAVDGDTDIESGEFATAQMDSFQIGVNPSSMTFESYFIEEDARFDAGAGERTDANEIIADGVLLPGTKVEYFVSSNYVVSPEERFLLPDTTGGFFSEFEILPGWVKEDGIYKFPALLYVDAYNRGAQFYIEAAFDALNLVYDRYDYLDATSNWKPPLARGLGSGSNNGATIYQLLGYRGILVSTGENSGNVMWPEDFAQLENWLQTISCNGNLSPQGLIINGDNAAGILSQQYPNLLNGPLGATFVGASYRDLSSPADANFCVRIEPLGALGAFSTRNSFAVYEYDAWGNGCPTLSDFDVLGTFGSGVGNRAYVDAVTGDETYFAQVVNQSGGNDDNYRTILDGVSWHHLSERDDVLECVADSAHIVKAAINEIAASLEWAFDTAANNIPIPEWSDEPCNNQSSNVEPTYGSSVAARLFQNEPNPFNPRTLLRFSLAADGPVELSIFDVQGRKIRTLQSGEMEAGAYEAVWEGTDEQGREVSAGVYWSQLEAAGWTANKKMIRVR